MASKCVCGSAAKASIMILGSPTPLRTFWEAPGLLPMALIWPQSVSILVCPWGTERKLSKSGIKQVLRFSSNIGLPVCKTLQAEMQKSNVVLFQYWFHPYGPERKLRREDANTNTNSVPILVCLYGNGKQILQNKMHI